MDAEITLERYCKKNNIKCETLFSDDEWEDMVTNFEEELDSFMLSEYEQGTFDEFLKIITTK